MRPLRIAVLVKQIPKVEGMVLGPDGRLVRDGLELEMNAYCRRAVATGCDLAGATGGDVVVVTLGPRSAEDALREAIAWTEERGTPVRGVLVSDPAFAGSDTLATARALAAVLEREGPFDLVLAGRNSVDADTGQVGPELAQLLDLPCVAGVRELSLVDGAVTVRLEHDDEWVEATVSLPAVLTVAERLCDPAKVAPDGRAAVAAERITTRTAADLGDGPWGADASATSVGEVRVLEVERSRRRLEGTIAEQVDAAVASLVDRGALDDGGEVIAEPLPPARSQPGDGPAIAVLVEPGRERLTRELLGAAARLALELGGRVVAAGTDLPPPVELGRWGADAALEVAGALVEEDVAAGVARWCGVTVPWAALAPSTAWGREVASRVAASLGAGLTGDAVGLTLEAGVEHGGGPRLVAWKPAFGGLVVAAVRSTSPVQLATVRAGVLALPTPREAAPVPVEVVEVVPRGRVLVHGRHREDDADLLAGADAVVGVGQGVDPADYPQLDPLLEVLGAELAATRKVTDKGWMPRARQLGITGHTIAPRLYVAVGLSGKFNHTMGVRSSGTILAVNPDPEALVFESADIGIVGDWREVVPLLVERIRASAALRTR